MQALISDRIGFVRITSSCQHGMHLGDDKREINVCRAGVVAGTLRDVAVDSCDMHKVCHCAAARASTGNKVAAEKRMRRGAQRMPPAATGAATAKYR